MTKTAWILIIVLVLGLMIFGGIYTVINWGPIQQTFREFRDNNPCGVNKSQTQESSMIGLTGNMDGPLYIYDSIQNGLINAALILKNITFGEFDANTLNQIAYRWTGGYTSYTGADMATHMGGIDPDTALDFQTYCSQILYALVCCENNQMAADLIPQSYYDTASAYWS